MSNTEDTDTIDRSPSENGRAASIDTKILVPEDKSSPSTEDSDAPTESSDATSAGSPATGEKLLRVRRIARRAAFPAVAVIAIVATVLAGFLGWKLHTKNEVEAASQAGLAAARAYAVTLTSVDSTNLDRDFAAVLDGSTGEFKDMYTRSSGQLRQLLLDNKAMGKGTVLDSAVKSASKTKIEVLLFIDQTVNNTSAPDPRVDRSRVAMTMELVDGRWLASKVYLP